MFKAIKEYVKNKKRLDLKAREVSNQEKIELHLKLNKGDEVSCFSTEEHKIASPELVDYLDNQISTISKKNNLTLCVHTSKKNPVDKEGLESVLDEHYKNEIVKAHIEARDMVKSGIMMLLVGVLIFTAYVLLKTFVVNSLWLELIDIASWVFVWEAVDCFFISQMTKRTQKEHCVKVVNAEIVVIKDLKD